jgi:protein-S-isoprenylcysteine O-methyltransferase Ste14
MRIFPEFGPGEYSGGYYTLIYLVVSVALVLTFRRGALKRLTASPGFGFRMKLRLHLEANLYFVSLAYPAWLKIPLGTAGFYAGTAVFLLGMVGYILTLWVYGRSPMDQPITRGIYRISRHPMYVSHFAAWMGVAIALQSIVLALANISLFILMHFSNRIEERECLKAYGEPYRQYMEQVPRYFLFF